MKTRQLLLSVCVSIMLHEKVSQKGKCFQCGRRHHVSICDNNMPSFATATLEEKPNTREMEFESSSVDIMMEQLWDLESVGIREKDTIHGSFIKNISKGGDKSATFM